MRIIQNPIAKLSDGTESAHCNFTLDITANTGVEYTISISADDNLGSGNRGKGKHDCYRTQLALFVQGSRNMDQEEATQCEEHCNEIMEKVLDKENYLDYANEDDLLELMYYLKNELKNDLKNYKKELGEAK